ncbi:MAG: hypothetical protein RSF40_01205 [Oscillospiraceae bacterium]
MNFTNTNVYNFSNALRAMRHPLESYDKSDSYEQIHLREDGGTDVVFVLGENDKKLAQKLIKAGESHRKFLRQILVSVDITAPLYWYKEFDTYKIGTTANSTSTMHKIQSKPITIDCFETGDYQPSLDSDGGVDHDCVPYQSTVSEYVDCMLCHLEALRQNYLITKDKRYWKELIRWLPSSWLQTRTVTMSYENLCSMYHQRKGHKLTEWSVNFVGWVESLPYAKELICL